MGDRGQVHIVEENVWLYTHYGATYLIETVKETIRRKARWDDPEYLARMIFEAMISFSTGREAGFGISGRGPHGDEWRIIHVDTEKQKITVEDRGKVSAEFTFVEIANERERATKLEFLEWMYLESDFGPADDDVRQAMKERFMEETGKNIPLGWNEGQDGETSMDKD